VHGCRGGIRQVVVVCAWCVGLNLADNRPSASAPRHSPRAYLLPTAPAPGTGPAVAQSCDDTAMKMMVYDGVMQEQAGQHAHASASEF
jgi:hypothetical protein